MTISRRSAEADIFTLGITWEDKNLNEATVKWGVEEE